MSASTTIPPAIDRRQPWLGLSSYREADSELFFGREKESMDLLRLVRREVLTVLFGPSGTGKTSLLNAGLFPRLRESGFLPIAIRLDHTGESPDYIRQIRSLIAGALRADASRPIEEEALAPPQAPADLETPWEYLHRVVFWDWRNNPVTPVLVFDQFEEIFTLGRNRAAIAEFLTALADLVENYIPAEVRSRMEARSESIPFPHDRPKCKVVLSLREDFVWRLDGLRKSVPSVMHNRFSIARMNGEQALLAVREPGQGIVTGPVAEQIVRFVAAANQSRAADDGESGLEDLQVDPALLSVVCRELNARRIEQEKDRITEELIEQAGANILNDFYERSFADLNPAVRVFVEDRLLTASGFRSTVPLEEATQAGIAVQDIRTLVDRRLIRTEDRLGIPHLELTHDLLTKVVQSSRAERQERDRRARESQQRELEERKRAEEEGRRRAELRRARLLLGIVSGAAVICLLLGLLAFVSYRGAVDARTAAEDATLRLKTEKDKKELAQEGQIKAQEGQIKAQDETKHQRILRTWQSAAQQVIRDTAEHADDDRSALLARQAMLLHERTPDQPKYLVEVALQSAVSLGTFAHVLRGHESGVQSAAFAPDGSRVASAGSDKTIRIWDLRHPDTPPEVLLGHKGIVHAVAFAPDGQRLASASQDRTVRLWDLRHPGTPPHVLAGHQDSVGSLAFAPDGSLLASGSNDGTVRVWDPRRLGSPPRVLSGPEDGITSVSFTSDGNVLKFASKDGTVRTWDVRQPDALPQVYSGGQEHLREYMNFTLAYILHNSVGTASSVAFSPDGNRLACSGQDGSVLLWDLRQPNAPPQTLSKHDGPVLAVAFARDGNLLASAGFDRTVRVWDLLHPKAPPQVLPGHQSAVLSVAFADDGNRLVSAGIDRTVRVLELRQPNAPTRILPKAESSLYAVAFSPDGHRVASGSQSGVVTVWDLRRLNAPLKLLSGKAGDVVSFVAFAREGNRLAARFNSGMRVWDLRRPDAPPQIISQKDTVAFAPDGDRFASDSDGQTIRIWDLRQPKAPPQVLSGQGGKILSVAFAPYGERVASGSDDGKVRVWDLQHPKAPSVILSDQGEVQSVVAFSPDGHRLASGSDDHNIRVWDLRQPKAPPQVLSGHKKDISSVAFAPEGDRLASGSSDNTVRVWDLRQPDAPPEIFVGHEDAVYDSVYSVAVAPDGSVASVSSDRTLRIWPMWTAAADYLCTRVWRNLSMEEWRLSIGEDIPYERTCPNLPPGAGAPGGPK
ncbi:putative NTPase-like protein [Candidatus Sulfopaludibacter sp. SbA4]|nr:putative NTPase-like protein [Candidatus Sulfopaludibacter sp. SbA4]